MRVMTGNALTPPASIATPKKMGIMASPKVPDQEVVKKRVVKSKLQRVVDKVKGMGDSEKHGLRNGGGEN